MHEIRDVYLLNSPMSLPEGVAFDSRTRRFFATALFGGQITQIDAATGEEQVFFTSEEPLQFSGAKVDEANRRLWVCASDIRGPRGGLHLFDVDSGALLQHFPLAARGICNDVCLDADGVAYVTDSFQPVIYRVDARDGSAREFIRDAQMAAPMGQFGLNGIVVTPDGEGPRRLPMWIASPSACLAASIADGLAERRVRVDRQRDVLRERPHLDRQRRLIR
jgi:sugar lactone lactonase YvrE